MDHGFGDSSAVSSCFDEFVCGEESDLGFEVAAPAAEAEGGVAVGAGPEFAGS